MCWRSSRREPEESALKINYRQKGIEIEAFFRDWGLVTIYSFEERVGGGWEDFDSVPTKFTFIWMGKISHFEWFLGYEPKKYVINSADGVQAFNYQNDETILHI